MNGTERPLFYELKSSRSDFSLNATMEDISLWADKLVTCIQNSEESWQRDGKNILEAADGLVPEKPHLAVRILFGGENEEEFEDGTAVSSGSEENTTDSYAPDNRTGKKSSSQENAITDVVLNLQYFFPYCDQALRSHPELEIILIVVCLNVADQQRVRRYLSAMNSAKPRLCIVTAISKSKTPPANTRVNPVRYDTKNIGALLPVFCIGKSRNVTPSLNNEEQIEDLSVEKLSFYDRALCEYLEKQYKKENAQSPQYNMLLEAGYTAIDGINALFYGSAPKRKKEHEKAVKELEAGIQKLKINDKEKEKKETELRNRKETLGKVESELNRCEDCLSKFWKEIHNKQDPKDQSRLQRIPFLTQVLWLCCLYHLMDQGEIFDRKTFTFQRDPINLILWDALNYSEGILQLLENCELHSQHNCGYLSIYFHRIGLQQVSQIVPAAKRRQRIFRRYRVNRNDSFENVSESLYLEFNIIDMGRDKNYGAQGITVRSRENLLPLFEGNDLSNDFNKAAHHYGMPLFYRTVLLKQGRFICTTPNDDSGALRLVGRRFANRQEKSECVPVPSSQAWTGYQILLPLTLCAQDDPTPVKCGRELLDSSYLKCDPEQKCMPSKFDCHIIYKNEVIPKSINVNSAQDKINNAENVCSVLSARISDEESAHTVYALEMIGMSSLDLEIYLKGLFLFIAQNQERGLLFRLLFSNEYALSEAVRRFSIFYEKNGENSWMGKTQVAFCSAKEGYFPIRLILAGADIATARVTAKQYMQYNIDIESGFLLSQIKYLTTYLPKEGKDSPETCPLFPFDLTSAPVNDEAGEKITSASSDFERKIYGILNAELQDRGCGCKISKAHVRLGSKIHIQDFYDAELLFQSVGNVYRFAYLIAEEILQYIKDSWEASRSLYLIGYENYSSVLVEEIIRLLKHCYPNRENDIWHYQYIKAGNTDDSDGQIVCLDCREDQSHSSAIMVTILPIGTTLSTIYKIRNTFLRNCKEALPIDQQYNFSLILVSPAQESGATNGASYENTELGPDRFWESSKGQTVVLKPESVCENDTGDRVTVRWFFKVKTKWMAADHCALCNCDVNTRGALGQLQMLPLSQVDKTSTHPTLIFPAQHATVHHGISFSIPRGENENAGRLEQMKNCVDYGHILRDANHYQFYVDFERYYQNEWKDCTIRKDCISWFEEIQKEIDQDSFNIVVSPLQDDNCRFIKDAIDRLFLHSLRFIYIPLHQVYREEIRSRFSYIAKEYEDACAGSIPPKYNVYYIDYSVVSGESLHRSRALIQMLLNDAAPRVQIGFFKKVILLTNRSSYDTAATFVQNPETDFLAFSTLCIPSYNTLKNRCPACEMVETYRTIAKCSATNELFWHYSDLAQKHELQTLTDYRENLESIHFTRANYLSYFCQSLVLGLDREFTKEKDNDTELNFDELKRAFKVSIDTAASKSQNRLTMRDVLASMCNEDHQKDIRRYYEALLAGRNWRRLICTHEAVLMTEKLLNDETNKKTAAGIGEEMLNIISARLSQCPGGKPFEKREWLISYIKAFSREYPSKIAPIRAAAYILLERFFLELLSTPSQSNDMQEKAAPIIPGLQMHSDITALLHTTADVSSDPDIAAAERLQLYQLYLVLGKRLCDLQSNLLFQYETLKKVDAFLVALLSEQKEMSGNSCFYGGVLKLPDKEHLQSDYLYMLKWAAMSSKEEAKAFLLQNLTQKALEALDESSDKKNSNQTKSERGQVEHLLIDKNFLEVIRQENTRVLYTGIKRLHEVIKYEGSNWNVLQAEVKKAMLCAGWPDQDNNQNAAQDDSGQDTSLNENGNYHPIYQNPLCDLLKYLDTDLTLYPGDDTSLSSASQLLTALLTFYRLMEKLKMENRLERETEKDYIDIYSRACFILSKLGNYSNCCLVHKTNGENVVIAQYLTGFVVDLPKKLQEIFNDSGIVEKLDGETLYNTVAQYEPKNEYEPENEYESKNERLSALVLAFRIKQRSDITYQQKVYAVLFNVETKKQGKKSSQDTQMDRSHYLLFMRQQFQASLERDLYALHHFKFSREDVNIIQPDDKAVSPKSIAASETADASKITAVPEDRITSEGTAIHKNNVASEGNNDSNSTEAPLCILHLSDLHVSKENEDTILNLITSHKNELKERNPQLLLITGDIAQGTGSAVDLEDNYTRAGHVIRKIAETLWTTAGLTDDQKILHGDWKKRIIIIPGNHDYSAMNELVASSTLRVTKLGVPTRRPGSPMSRYAYYIQFLLNFLDIDSKQTIQNNLNAVFEYPAFMLRFIALNSVAEVGPLRNNKVQLDKAYINSLPKLTQNDGFLNICLSHHTWCYTPDYFADRYGAGTPKLTGPAIELAKEIIEACAEGREELRNGRPEEAVEIKIKEKLDKLTGEKKTEYHCLSKSTAGSEISQDILYLQNHWADITDERCQHIILDYELNEDMAKVDSEEYRKRISELRKKYRIAIMLGGHTHQAGWTDSLNHWTMAKDLCKKCACAEAPKFYCPQEGVLRFGRLLIRGDGDKRELEYQFVPKTPIRQLINVSF